MPEAISVVKLRLDPDKKTAAVIDGQSKILNWLYNNLLERANNLKALFKETKDTNAAKVVYTKRGLRNELPALKVEKPFLSSVHSSPLKNAALRLSKSIRDFQDSRKGKRAGKPTGWPKFRSFKAGFFSLFYDEPNKGFKVDGQTLKLSLGVDEAGQRLRVNMPMPEAHVLKDKVINNLQITKDGDSYFAIFTVQRSVAETKLVKKIIALDPNHKNLGYGVDNHNCAIEIEAPWWLKTYDKRIDELKAKRDKCKRKSLRIEILDKEGNQTGRYYFKESRRYKRYNEALQKALTKRREQTKTYLYTIANALYKNYDLVTIGDYTPRGGGITKPMRRAMNNRSLIGRFKGVLSWVAQKSGKAFEEWPEKGTTRTCHACEYIAPDGIAPSVRGWTCPNCKIVHIRDENAAINGLRRSTSNKKGLEQSKPVPCSGPVLVKKRWAWRVRPSGVVNILRGVGSSAMNKRQEIFNETESWELSVQTLQND